MATRSETALLLFSHGSVLCGTDRLLDEHAARLGNVEFCAVVTGFLNYSRPAFEESVQACIAAGARRIVIVPYFLVSGRFVTYDLPARIEAVRTSHPQIELIIAEPLLDEPLLAQAVLNSADHACEIQEARSHCAVPHDDCELRPECPLFRTSDCPRNGEYAT